MYFKNLSVQNFRNLESLNISFNERLNIIIGDNGQGKTNILEAVYLLTEGESFRYSKNENLISLEQTQASLFCQAANGDLEYKISMRLTPSKKEVSINNKTSSLNRLDKFSAVLFSPESLNIIKESSDERRELVDQLVVQIYPNGKNILQEYKKVLKTRNKILRDIAEEKVPLNMGLDTLESLNTSFLRLAGELTNARLKQLKEIKPYVELALQDIHLKGDIKFDFNYVFSDENHRNSDPELVVNAMQKRMLELRSAEIKTGLSLVGPQKHDVIFLYNGNDSRFYCSQGQQRSIILAYKMAQIVYHHRVHGFYPLLLLDDVLSELDLTKQESLISTLNQTETQTFVTTTDVSLLSKLSMTKASVFKIKNGKIL